MGIFQCLFFNYMHSLNSNQCWCLIVKGQSKNQVLYWLSSHESLLIHAAPEQKLSMPGVFPLNPIVAKSCKIDCCGNKMHHVFQNMILSVVFFFFTKIHCSQKVRDIWLWCQISWIYNNFKKLLDYVMKAGQLRRC